MWGIDHESKLLGNAAKHEKMVYCDWGSFPEEIFPTDVIFVT